MPVCSLCGAQVEEQCPNCKYPDAKIERKFNKHGGKAPTSARQNRIAALRGETAPDPNRRYVWPKFKKGASQEQPLPDGPPRDLLDR